MPPAGFEPTIPTSERPQTHILGRAATGISLYFKTNFNIILQYLQQGIASDVPP
jgi:hypothetical protein